MRASPRGRHGEEAERQRAPDARHAVRGDRADRVVDPEPLDEQHADDDDRAGDEPDHDRRPRRDERARGRDRDERGDRAVQHHREVGLLDHEPRRDRRRRARRPPPRGSCSARRTRRSRRPPKSTPSVEPGLKPNQPNQRMITPSVTNAMLWPGIAFGFPSRSNLPMRGPSSSAPASAGERALVVDDGRAGEVLHPLREQPAVRAPDPVRDDRVDQREDDAEREVDPELRPLGHRAPDDRERDARRTRPRTGTPAAPGIDANQRERRRADREQLVDRGQEARAADEPVAAVAERDPEADERSRRSTRARR